MNAEMIHQDKIQSPNGLLFVDDGGIDQDVPIVFAHSFLGNTEHWENQLEFFRQRTRAVAFDFPSHGKSEKSRSDNFSAEGLAQDIEAVVSSLGLNRFILVGHSMGGSAAVAYTGLHPDKVSGLVLAGTPGKSEKQMAQSIVSSLESDSYEKVMDQYMKQLVDNSTPDTHKKVMSEMKNMDKKTSVTIVRSLFEFDPLPILKKYQGPKLIIYTSNENKQPNSLHSQAPEIEGKLLEGTSHWTQMDKPNEFNRILEDFRRRVPK